MENRSIIKEWLCDSVIAFLLIMAGIRFSQLFADRFQAHDSIGYLCCFVVAQVPFAYFLGIRRGFFLWWEYVGFFVCLVSMAVARDRIAQLGPNRTLITAVATGVIFGYFIWLHGAVRTYLTVPASDGS